MEIPTKPTIAIIGHKNSGKTLLIEKLIKALVEKGYNIASAKHIGRKGHTFDMPRKDTSKHLEAGANPVIAISENETVIIRKNHIDRPLETIFENIPENVNVILLEGFSGQVLSNENIPKIVCIKNEEELREYKEKGKNIILFSSLNKINRKETLHIIEDFHQILEKTIAYIENQERLIKIYKGLPGLNCGKCRFKTCFNMAKAILNNKASKNECVVLKQEKGIRILVNNEEVPTTPFVEKIIKTTVLSMLSTLKGVNIENKQETKLRIEVET